MGGNTEMEPYSPAFLALNTGTAAAAADRQTPNPEEAEAAPNAQIHKAQTPGSPSATIPPYSLAGRNREDNTGTERRAAQA